MAHCPILRLRKKLVKFDSQRRGKCHAAFDWTCWSDRRWPYTNVHLSRWSMTQSCGAVYHLLFIMQLYVWRGRDPKRAGFWRGQFLPVTVVSIHTVCQEFISSVPPWRLNRADDIGPSFLNVMIGNGIFGYIVPTVKFLSFSLIFFIFIFFFSRIGRGKGGGIQRAKWLFYSLNWFGNNCKVNWICSDLTFPHLWLMFFLLLMASIVRRSCGMEDMSCLSCVF